MAKHDNHYKSFFGYFLDLRDRYRDEDGESQNEYYCDPDMPQNQDWADYHLAQLKGGLEPIVNMGKEFKDAFLRYKRFADIGRDLAQPFRGIGNLIQGVFTLIAVPFVFLVRTCSDFNIYFKARMEYFSEPECVRGAPPKYPKNNLTETTSWLLEGISNILRGAIQIITTPLAWVKVIVMGSISAFKGFRKIEEDPGFKRNLEIAVNNTGYRQIDALERLHEKFRFGLDEERATDIANTQEDAQSRSNTIKSAEMIVYDQFINNKGSEEARQQYISFFQKRYRNEQTKIDMPENEVAGKAFSECII